MSVQEIESLFQEKVQIKGIHKNLDGDAKSKIYNYRKRGTTFALKLEFLYQIGAIKIISDESSK